MDTIDNTLAPRHLIAKLDTVAIPATGGTAITLWSALSAANQAILLGSGVLWVDILSPTVAVTLSSAAAAASAQWLIAAATQERVRLTGSTDATLGAIFVCSNTGSTVTNAMIRVFYRPPL